MMCQSSVELIANYSGHILIMEHADHRDSASLMRHALRNFCALICGLYLAHITSWDMYEHLSSLDKYVEISSSSCILSLPLPFTLLPSVF